MRVIVVPPDPSWPARFDAFAGGIRDALGEVAVAIHHIGSTSIPGIHAKPIIDVLVEATSLDDLDARANALVAVGYESLGEFGIPGRRYFRMDDQTGTRICQIHAFEVESSGAIRHLAFRDFMRAHPERAREYSELKIRLAGQDLDIEAYMDGKDAFIKEMERQALDWWIERTTGSSVPVRRYRHRLRVRRSYTEEPKTVCHDDIISLYERKSAEYDRVRGRGLQELEWLERFCSFIPDGGTILDLGCGSGEPLATYFVGRGYRVFGVDGAPSMISLCRSRLPEQEWLVHDMRGLVLDRRFDGVLAWDSFFHLRAADQRLVIQQFGTYARQGAPVLFTSGHEAGEAIGTLCGEPLFHESMAPETYRRLLSEAGFAVEHHVAVDSSCGDHTIWLATYRGTQD